MTLSIVYARRALAFIAALCFLLAVFSVTIGGHSLIPVGAFFLACSLIV